MTEKKIQEYIWKNRENWTDLIEKIKFPSKLAFEEIFSIDGDDELIYNASPSKIFYNELIDRLEEIYNNLFELNLFGCEVPLKKEGDSTIRADLLGCVGGVSGITIIEIKRSAQTERQAYTELFGYAAHLQSIFPTMSKDDIQYVLISPMEERIVREATIYSFIFDEKPVFAFIPIWDNNDISTLRLRPWLPELETLVKITDITFLHKNFDVFKVCWEKIDNWNAEKHEIPDEFMIKRMNNISIYAAQLMEARGIHGFVYASQSYPEMPFLPNELVVVGLNPFKIAKDNYLLKERNLSPFKLHHVSDESINLLDIIPELKSKAKDVNEKNEYFYDLTISWRSTIIKIAFDSIKTMTHNYNGITLEKSWGGMNWKDYQQTMFEDSFCFHYDIRPTGIIRKLFVSSSIEDYNYIAKNGYKDHLFLHHGDVPNFMVDYLYEQAYFREFLYNLFESSQDLANEFEDSSEEEE